MKLFEEIFCFIKIQSSKFNKHQMKIIITGSTGMIGEGVLLECLDNPTITEILSVSRKPSGKTHPKLKEYIVSNFLDLKPNDPQLQGYDACFFCAGISSIGMKEAEFTQIAYDTTLTFAKALNPNPKMSFVYVSGSGTDSSEKGNLMWARVKGKTENDLMRLPFKQAFGFRIGMVEPRPDQQYILKYYKYFAWLAPLLRSFFPNSINNIKQIAQAMIYVSENGYSNNVIFVKDIHSIAGK